MTIKENIANNIIALRKSKDWTQADLARELNYSDKTISKWETGKGYPDISLVESLAEALGVSVIELMSGNDVTNSNISANMLKTKLYACPVCGNVITSIGEAVISCCGITLPALEAEKTDEEHRMDIELIEDELFVKVNHSMTKQHYISFIAAVSDNNIDIVKLYPEGEAEARFKIRRTKKFYYYCNKHGLFEQLRPRKWDIL
mgnify:CR=1 FL=1